MIGACKKWLRELVCLKQSSVWVSYPRKAAGRWHDTHRMSETAFHLCCHRPQLQPCWDSVFSRQPQEECWMLLHMGMFLGPCRLY